MLSTPWQTSCQEASSLGCCYSLKAKPDICRAHLQLLVVTLVCAGLTAVPDGSSHTASHPLSTKGCSWSKCQTAPAPRSQASRGVSLWHLHCPARRDAGNGYNSEPGPLPRTGCLHQPRTLRAFLSSFEFQLARVRRGEEPEVK